MSHYPSFSLVLTVGVLVVALALSWSVASLLAQPSVTIVAIEGATTTYHSIDRHGKVMTVQVPSQSAADIKGVDAQGNV